MPSIQSKPAQTADDAGPPLTIDATIQLAWGLTLNLSHETTQNATGKDFMEWLKILRTSYENDKTAQFYIDNLYAILSSYLRTSAFEREVYVGYLDTYKNLREANTKNITAIGDLASVSSGSLLTKLAAFVGFGSLIEIIGVATHLATPTQGLPFNLNYLIFGGLGGLIATIIAFRLARGWLIQRVEKHSYRKQLLLWKNTAKPAFIRELLFLLERLRPLVKKMYKNYNDDGDIDLISCEVKPLKLYLEGATKFPKNDTLAKYFESMLPDSALYKITKKQKKQKKQEEQAPRA